MKKWVSLWIFLLVGVAIAAWAAMSLISPSISCRGVEMRPGDVCEYASPDSAETDKVQTYEERLETARRQAPVGVVVGAGMAVFGVYLMIREVRSDRDQASSDIGP